MQQLSTYLNTADHPILNQILGKLIERYFKSSINMDTSTVDIDSGELRFASWLASLLANSPLGEHRNKAMAFGALAYLSFPDDAAITALCYTIQARTGNIPASHHLQSIVDNKCNQTVSLSPLLDIEISGARASASCDTSVGSFFATEAQKKFWTALNDEHLVSFSAPTSAGKSFIIRRYIEHRVKESGRFLAVYIVPSKALIAQVSQSLGKIGQDGEMQVWTTFPHDGADAIGKKAIFILTQERCLRLLEEADNLPSVDFVFVDEIQKIEDGDRGGLLEYVIQEIRREWPTAQVALAGPLISELSKLASRLLQDNTTGIETVVTPVVQMVAAVRPIHRKRELDVTIRIQSAETVRVTVPVSSALHTRWQNAGVALADSVKLLGGGTQSIVYAPQKDYAEIWATRLLREYGPQCCQNSISTELSDLVDFLDEEIGPDYPLAKLLHGGIAFHHAGIPEFIRNEIEELFASDQIKVMFCTPTLMEGVNLPAERIFVIRARRGNKDLEQMDFRNLTGRAGRMGNHLAGIAFCIEEGDEWLNEMLDDEGAHEVIPTTEKALYAHRTELIDFLRMGNIDASLRDIITYTACLLRNRAMKGEAYLRDYLTGKGIEGESLETLIGATTQGLTGISVPPEICRKNPMVDPVRQNDLYVSVLGDGYGEWVVNSRVWQGTTTASSIGADESFYCQFEQIMQKLDHIFAIEVEANNKHPFNQHSLRQMVYYAVPWIRGSRYRELIDMWRSDPESNTKKAKDASKAVRQVMSIISDDICHVVVKYLKVLTDVLRSLMTPEEQETYKFSLALPTIVEFGCSDPCAMSLMSHGLPRATALILGKLVPPAYRESALEWLRSHPEVGLPALHRRFVERLGVWPESGTEMHF